MVHIPQNSNYKESSVEAVREFQLVKAFKTTSTQNHQPKLGKVRHLYKSAVTLIFYHHIDMKGSGASPS